MRRESMTACAGLVGQARALCSVGFGEKALDLLDEALELLNEAPTQKREKDRVRQAKSRAKRKPDAASRVTGCDTNVTRCDSEVEVGVVEVGVGVEEGEAALAWWGTLISHTFRKGETSHRRYVIRLLTRLFDEEGGDIDAAKRRLSTTLKAKADEWRGTDMFRHLMPEVAVRKFEKWEAQASVMQANPVDVDPGRYTGPTESERDAARRVIKACPDCMAMMSGACGKHMAEGMVA